LSDFADILFSLFRRFGVHGNALPVAPHRLKANLAFHEGKQRIVASAPDVYAGVDFCAALPDENIPSEYELPVRALRAETLGLTVATVLGRTHSFFMRQFVSLLCFKR
jgi:hypothetical protein